MEDFLTHVDTN